MTAEHQKSFNAKYSGTTSVPAVPEHSTLRYYGTLPLVWHHLRTSGARAFKTAILRYTSASLAPPAYQWSRTRDSKLHLVLLLKRVIYKVKNFSQSLTIQRSRKCIHSGQNSKECKANNGRDRAKALLKNEKRAGCFD